MRDQQLAANQARTEALVDGLVSPHVSHCDLDCTARLWLTRKCVFTRIRFPPTAHYSTVRGLVIRDFTRRYGGQDSHRTADWRKETDSLFPASRFGFLAGLMSRLVKGTAARRHWSPSPCDGHASHGQSDQLRRYHLNRTLPGCRLSGRRCNHSLRVPFS